MGSDVQNSIFAGRLPSPDGQVSQPRKLNSVRLSPVCPRDAAPLVLLATLLACHLGASPVRAHPISLTQAFVFVTREQGHGQTGFLCRRSVPVPQPRAERPRLPGTECDSERDRKTQEIPAGAVYDPRCAWPAADRPRGRRRTIQDAGRGHSAGRSDVAPDFLPGRISVRRTARVPHVQPATERRQAGRARRGAVERQAGNRRDALAGSAVPRHAADGAIQLGQSAAGARRLAGSPGRVVSEAEGRNAGHHQLQRRVLVPVHHRLRSPP